ISSYFDRTNKVNRVIAVENIPDRKKVRSYFCDKVLNIRFLYIDSISSYFDRTNKVNRVIAVENIPDRKKVRSYFCDKVLKPLVLLLSVFLWGFLFFLWLR
ncbi:hypothetical protein DXA71_10170, partial [Parabacteroides distasonis]